MFKALLAASALASASAFAPAATGKAATQLNAFESELGVQPPLGFWDPLGLLDDADQEYFDRLRYIEIKHGRISMLAFLGNIWVRAGNYLDGDIDKSGDAFSSYPPGIAALFGEKAIPSEGFWQLIAFIGVLEFSIIDTSGWNDKWTPEFPGDVSNGAANSGFWSKKSDEWKKRKRGIELNNGRAAMCGILGLMVHEELHTNLPIVGQL